MFSKSLKFSFKMENIYNLLEIYVKQQCCCCIIWLEFLCFCNLSEREVKFCAPWSLSPQLTLLIHLLHSQRQTQWQAGICTKNLLTFAKNKQALEFLNTSAIFGKIQKILRKVRNSKNLKLKEKQTEKRFSLARKLVVLYNLSNWIWANALILHRNGRKAASRRKRGANQAMKPLQTSRI